MAHYFSLDGEGRGRGCDCGLPLTEATHNVTRHTMFNPPITVGEMLLEDYLKPMGISQNAMARAIGVSPRAINDIVFGKRAITPAMSVRFGKFFAQSPQFWHGLQVDCDFRALKINKIAPSTMLPTTACGRSQANLDFLYFPKARRSNGAATNNKPSQARKLLLLGATRARQSCTTAIGWYCLPL